MQNNFIIFLTLLLSFFLTACTTFDKLREPRPLSGKDVSIHPLGDGQVDFVLKISGLTSTLWVSTELVNKSRDVVDFDTANLLQFEDPTCLENKEFEKPRKEILEPGERQLIRFTFRLYARQKHSAHYERCKNQPLKFIVSTVRVSGKELPKKSLTIQPD